MYRTYVLIVMEALVVMILRGRFQTWSRWCFYVKWPPLPQTSVDVRQQEDDVEATTTATPACWLQTSSCCALKRSTCFSVLTRMMLEFA